MILLMVEVGMFQRVFKLALRQIVLFHILHARVLPGPIDLEDKILVNLPGLVFLDVGLEVLSNVFCVIALDLVGNAGGGVKWK